MKLLENNALIRTIKCIFNWVNPGKPEKQTSWTAVVFVWVVIVGLPFGATAYCLRTGGSADSNVSDGAMYQEMGLNENALKVLDRAIKIDPYYSTAYYFRAKTYAEWCLPSFVVEEGNYTWESPSVIVLPPAIDCEEKADVPRATRNAIAIENLNKAIELNPKYADAYWYRADMHNQSGDWNRADPGLQSPSSSGAHTYTGITGPPRAAAVYNAGWSVTLRSRRSQTRVGLTSISAGTCFRGVYVTLASRILSCSLSHPWRSLRHTADGA